METKESRIFRLAEIITRSLREELPAPERAMLEEWLAQDERHQTLYDSFGQDEVLAEQVRALLAQYPADDPAVEALKQSAAYQKVARLIEGPEPGMYGGIKS